MSSWPCIVCSSFQSTAEQGTLTVISGGQGEHALRVSHGTIRKDDEVLIQDRGVDSLSLTARQILFTEWSLENCQCQGWER